LNFSFDQRKTKVFSHTSFYTPVDPSTKPSVLEILPSKIREYVDRAKFLDEQLAKNLNPPQNVPDAPTFSHPSQPVANPRQVLNGTPLTLSSVSTPGNPAEADDDDMEARFRRLRMTDQTRHFASTASPIASPSPPVFMHVFLLPFCVIYGHLDSNGML
jgi:hypothetical protein